LVAVGGMVEVC